MNRKNVSVYWMVLRSVEMHNDEARGGGVVERMRHPG